MFSHFYSMSRARYISGQWTTQLEQCSVGGTRNKHWNQRLANTESQMSINNAYDRRLGQAWGTQVSSGSVAAELGLEVDTGFAKISGTLPVSTGGHEAGSIGRSMCSDAPLSGNAGNEVNGAWNHKYPGYGTATSRATSRTDSMNSLNPTRRFSVSAPKFVTRPGTEKMSASRGPLPPGLAKPVAFVLISMVGALLLGACRHLPDDRDPSTTRAGSHEDSQSAAASRALDHMGTGTVYVMAGSDLLHAGLGEVTVGGLEPVGPDLSMYLLSNVSGQGAGDVVLGGVQSDSGVYSDGIYEIHDGRLVQLSTPGSRLYAPARTDEFVAAIKPYAGFYVLRHDSWKHYPSSGRMDLSTVVGGANGALYSILHPGHRDARLIKFAGNSSARLLALLPCASNLTISLAGDYLAVMPPPIVRSSCGRGTVIDVGDGAKTRLPLGWTPLVWSRDGNYLLVSSERQLGVWSIAAGSLIEHWRVPTHVWMAALAN